MTARQGLLGALGALAILSTTFAAPQPANAEEKQRDSTQAASDSTGTFTHTYTFGFDTSDEGKQTKSK